MRVLLSRINYQGTTLDEVKANQEAVRNGEPDRLPRSVLVENAVSYQEAVNQTEAHVGREIRTFDRATISLYEFDRNGARISTPQPLTDAVIQVG